MSDISNTILSMRGQVTEVLKIYDSSDKQLVIPVYQRNYDWKVKHCEQLLTDLVDLIRFDRPKHFFGAVVGKPEDSWTWVVIDGQQRLTTVSLLMLALANLAESGALPCSMEDLGAKIRRSYLLNDVENQKTRFRLKPIKDDSNAYRKLFGPETEFIESSNVTANYRYFLDALPKSGVTADQIWSAISRLEVMHLDLEEHDDPQRIFESLNSTGLELSEADKIRNLVLMGLGAVEQERVYEDFWNRIEINVEFQTDEFLRWYLVTKTSNTPRKDQVFDAFKAFKQNTDIAGADLLLEVRSYSDYYRQIRNENTGSSKIDARLRRVNMLGQDVILPLLMPLLAEFHDGSVTETDFETSLQIIESFLFRRFVSNIATNSLNKIFANLYKDVRKLRRNSNSFAEVLAYSLTRRTGGARYPDNQEFAADFAMRDMYNVKSDRRRYLFECLENLNSNDTREIANALEAGSLSIEHIMPQTLTKEWLVELGDEAEEVHNSWLHRIANLTVTGYNSLYSNSSFQEKKSIENGFNDSPYRINKEVKNLERWNERSLQERSKELTKRALEYWGYPGTSFEPVTPQLPVEGLGVDTVFTNRDIVAYEFMETKATVSSWREFFVQVLKLVAQQDHEALFAFAKTNSYFVVNNDSEELGPEFQKVVPGLRVSTQSSTQDKVVVLRRLLDALRVDPDDLLVTLRSEATSDNGNDSVDSTPAEREGLARLLDLLEDFQGTAVQPDDTLFLREELLSELDLARARDFVPAQKRYLDMISGWFDEEELLGTQVIHRTILDGSLLKIINALTADN